MLNPTAGRYERTFYDVCNLVYRQAKRESQELKSHEKSLIEKHDYKIGDFLPFRDCVVGTYDDYGGIEEDLLPEDYEEIREQVQFYHVWAVEFLLGESIEELMKNKVEFISKFYEKLYFLRKNPLNLQLMGQQHKDVEEMELMVKMNNRINQYLECEIKKQKQWENE